MSKISRQMWFSCSSSPQQQDWSSNPRKDPPFREDCPNEYHLDVLCLASMRIGRCCASGYSAVYEQVGKEKGWFVTPLPDKRALYLLLDLNLPYESNTLTTELSRSSSQKARSTWGVWSIPMEDGVQNMGSRRVGLPDSCYLLDSPSEQQVG